MTGLDLESFLLLLRADLTHLGVLGPRNVGPGVPGLVVLAVRDVHSGNASCLSLAAHLGFVLYGSTVPAVMWAVGTQIDETKRPSRTSSRDSGRASLVETR